MYSNLEEFVRHIMCKDFDQSKCRAKTSAFSIGQLKKGLSVSRNSLLDTSTYQCVIQDLEKGGKYTLRQNLRAYGCDVTRILDDSKSEAFNISFTPQPNNYAHAEIKFSLHLNSEGRATQKKFRKKLMDVFQ